MSAVDAVRRAGCRDIARDRLDELAGQESTQLVVGVTGGELAEVLARPPLGEKATQQALHCRSHLGGRQAKSDRTGDRLMAADGAADAEVVGVDDRSVDFDLLALDAEIGDPMLAAAVRAARDVDPELLIEAR